MSARSAAPEQILCDTSFVSVLQRAAGNEAARSQIQGWPAAVQTRLDAAVLLISVITLAELRAGFEYAAWGARRRASAEAMLAAYGHVPLDGVIVHRWGQLWAELQRAGRSLSHNDVWIASTALTRELPLVSCDRDFDYVPDLEHIYLP